MSQRRRAARSPPAPPSPRTCSSWRAPPGTTGAPLLTWRAEARKGSGEEKEEEEEEEEEECRLASLPIGNLTPCQRSLVPSVCVAPASAAAPSLAAEHQHLAHVLPLRWFRPFLPCSCALRRAVDELTDQAMHNTYFLAERMRVRDWQRIMVRRWGCGGHRGARIHWAAIPKGRRPSGTVGRRRRDKPLALTRPLLFPSRAWLFGKKDIHIPVEVVASPGLSSKSAGLVWGSPATLSDAPRPRCRRPPALPADASIGGTWTGHAALALSHTSYDKPRRINSECLPDGTRSAARRGSRRRRADPSVRPLPLLPLV